MKCILCTCLSLIKSRKEALKWKLFQWTGKLKQKRPASLLKKPKQQRQITSNLLQAVANIIDPSYFIREISLASRGASGVNDSIISFIDEYEVKYLYMLLGKTLADQFIAGWPVLPTPDAKWTALKNQLADATKKLSPIANYVYIFIQENNITNTAGTSEVKAKNENSYPASPIDKDVKAWNKMVDMSRSVYEWAEARPTDYPALIQPVRCSYGVESIFEYKNVFNL